MQTLVRPCLTKRTKVTCSRCHVKGARKNKRKKHKEKNSLSVPPNVHLSYTKTQFRKRFERRLLSGFDRRLLSFSFPRAAVRGRCARFSFRLLLGVVAESRPPRRFLNGFKSESRKVHPSVRSLTHSLILECFGGCDRWSEFQPKRDFGTFSWKRKLRRNKQNRTSNTRRNETKSQTHRYATREGFAGVAAFLVFVWVVCFVCFGNLEITYPRGR